MVTTTELSLSSLATGDHTPGPWEVTLDEQVPERGFVYIEAKGLFGLEAIAEAYKTDTDVENGDLITTEANALLMAAAPDMLAALLNVRKLIAEASMTGFNCKDGDWPERLFASQQVTSAAIAKAGAR